MTPMKNKEINISDRISESGQAAADWLVKLEIENNATEEEQIDFINWLRADPENETLYERCKLVWTMSKKIETDPEIAGFKQETARNAIEPRRDPIYGVKFRTLTALAACVAFIALLGVVTLNSWHTELPDVRYQTATGEQRLFELEDGSTILLNTSTEVIVDYEPKLRRVVLERGEALFDVAGNVDRPFVVVAGGGKIRAVGTLFSVRKDAHQVTVVLAEGEVEVEQLAEFNTVDRERKQLLPGQQIRYEPEGKLGEVEGVDVERNMQWRQGRLTFSDVRLVDVVNEVNRYTVTKIIIDDNDIQNEKVTAYFNIENIEGLLYALDKTLDIKAVRESGNIYLRKKQSRDG